VGRTTSTDGTFRAHKDEVNHEGHEEREEIQNTEYVKYFVVLNFVPFVTFVVSYVFVLLSIFRPPETPWHARV